MSIFDTQYSKGRSEESAPAEGTGQAGQAAMGSAEAASETAPREGSAFGLILSHVLVAVFAAVVALGVSRLTIQSAGNTPEGSSQPSSFHPPGGGNAAPTPGFPTPGFGGNRPGSANAPIFGSRPDFGNFPSAAGNGPGLNLPGLHLPGGNRPGVNAPGNAPAGHSPGGHSPGANVPGTHVPAANAPGGNPPGRETRLTPIPYGEIMDLVLPTTPAGRRRPNRQSLNIRRPLERELSSVRDAIAKAADIARNQGPEHAARYLERWVAEGNPESARIYVLLGTLWMKVGDADRAHQWLEKATQAVAPPGGDLAPPGSGNGGGSTPGVSPPSPNPNE